MHVPTFYPVGCRQVAATPEGLHRRCKSLHSHSGDRTDPRYRHKPSRLFVPAGADPDLLLQSINLRIEIGNPIKQQTAQLANRPR